MKKIAIISTSYFPNIWNGQGRSTFSTAYILAQKGYDVSVFTFTNKPAPVMKQQDGQVTIYYIGGISKPNDPVTSLPFADVPAWNERLLPLLLVEKFDTIILNGWHGMEAAKKYGLAKIVGIVPFLYTFTGWLKPLALGLEQEVKQREAHFITQADVLVAHTTKFAQKVVDYANREVYVIPNCHLDLSNSAEQAKPEIKPYQICAVGRVNREKSLERIIRVMAIIPEATLVIASPESSVGYYNCLLKLAKKEDVDHRIKFMGFQPTKVVRDLYRQSALAVVPSQFEPYGYAATDPMALGTPVLVSEWSFLDSYLGTPKMVFSSLSELADKIHHAFWRKPKETLNEIIANKNKIANELSHEYIGAMLDDVI